MNGLAFFFHSKVFLTINRLNYLKEVCKFGIKHAFFQ
jgi:hypothetical protein